MDQHLALFLTLFLCNGLGIVVYEGIFVYSFKRKKKFLLRLLVSLAIIGGVSVGGAFLMYGALSSGVEMNLRNVEIARIVANFLSLAMGSGLLFLCFDEKPEIMLFGAVAGSAAHIVGSNLYNIVVELIGKWSIYFSMFNGYSALSFVIYYGIHLGILVLGFFLFGRAFARMAKTFDRAISRSVIGLFVFFAYVMVGISGCQAFNPVFSGAKDSTEWYVFGGLMIVFGVFVLFVQRVSLYWIKVTQQRVAEERFHEDYHAHSVRQQRSMELMHRRAQDMQKQIRSMLKEKNMDSEFMDEVQDAIASQSAHIDTGNKALDKVLSQKAFACNMNDIQMTAMIEGEALDFMSATDINAFFGNAVDNATEYLTAGVEEEDRFIRISSYRNVNIYSVRIENFCNTKINFSPITGLPLTTNIEKNFHGFGTQSMKKVAEKYGGTVDFRREGDLFVVSALFVM